MILDLGAAAPSAKDVSLVREARAGSPVANAELVRRFWEDAYRVAYLLTADQGIAEDLAQEALISALKGLGSFDETRPMRPWIRQIAANKAIDWQRSRHRRPELISDEPELLVASGPLPNGIPDAAVGEELLAALARLDFQFRVVVVLRYLLGLEPREIAEITQTNPKTVRTRLHRGLRLLHTDLTVDERSTR